MGYLADKSEDHIERTRQESKGSERIYCELAHFQQSQISQLKNIDMKTNPKVKLNLNKYNKNRKEIENLTSKT